MAPITTTPAVPVRPGASREELERFLEDYLDELPLIDRAHHHLDQSIPLCAAILDRALRSAPAGGRALIIGGTSLLAGALLRQGYDVDIWRFPQSFITDDVAPHVTRDVTVTSLESDVPDGDYDLVVVPMVLEGLSGSVADFFGRISRGLSPTGTIIIATQNQSRGPVRVAALAGRPLVTQRNLGISMAWPPMTTIREYHRDDLAAAARATGMYVRRCEYVTTNRVMFALQPLSIDTYLAKKAAQLTRMLAPSLRDTLLAEIAYRVEAPPLDVTDQLDVTVVVSATRDADSLRATLGALEAQDYPRERWEALVLHDGADADVQSAIAECRGRDRVQVRDMAAGNAEGPRVRNAAMIAARGAFVAHIDDLCSPPAEWLKSAMVRVDDGIGALTGPVYPLPGSEPRYLEAPGLRSDRWSGKASGEFLFPIGNVIYRRAAALGANGFSEQFGTGADPGAGWDSELAWRLERMGWQVKFRPEMISHRRFPGPPTFILRHQLRKASELPGMYAKVPELRRGLLAGVFASRGTLSFDMMLAGGAMVLRRRRRRWLLLALPWFVMTSLQVWPAGRSRHSPRLLAKMGALHLAWLAGFIAGFVRARKLVL
jgi:hypothetical protein